MNKVFKFFAASISIATSLFSFSAIANADEVYPHAYLIQRFSGFNNGGYIRLVNGQENLHCDPCSSSSSRPSINKEMWVIFEGQPQVFEWIEAGQKRGLQLASLSENAEDDNPNQIHWEGHFVGHAIFEPAQGQIIYRATKYSTANPTGSATYQIKFTGSNTTWIVYVNGYQALTIYNVGFTQAKYIDIGIESKDDENTFDNGTYSDLWQYLSGANWKNVSIAPSAVQKVRLNLYDSTWDVNYNATNNRVTFTD